MAAVLSPALGGMLDAPTSTTWLGVQQKAGLHATWSSNDSDSESSDYASTPSISPRQPLAKSASGILAPEDGVDDYTDAQPGILDESVRDSCDYEAEAYGPSRPLQARLIYEEEVDLLRLGVVVHHESETLDDTSSETDTAARELLPILPPIEVSLQKKSGQFYQPGATGPSCTWPKSSFYPLADNKQDTQTPTDTTPEDHSDSPVLPRTPSPTANPSSPVWPSTSSSSPTSSSDGARSSSSSLSQDKPDADQAAETFYDAEEPAAPTGTSKDSAATIAGAAASLQAWVDSSEGSKQPLSAAAPAAPAQLRKKRVSFARLPDIDEQADNAAADADATTDDDTPPNAAKSTIAGKELPAPAAAAVATVVGVATPPVQSPARAPATPSPRREPAADSLEGISARFAAITANLNLRLESASRGSSLPRPTPSTATPAALPTPQPTSSAPRSLGAAVAATATIATTAATAASKSIPAPAPAPAPRTGSRPAIKPAQQAVPTSAPTIRAKPVLATSSEIVAAPTATAPNAPTVARAAVAPAVAIAAAVPAVATAAPPAAVAVAKPTAAARPMVISQKDLEMQSISNNGYEPSKTFWSLFMWNRTANVTRKADYVPATNLGYEKALLERKAAKAAAKAGAPAGEEEAERTPSVVLSSCGKAAPKV